ncbi:efflux RND transporter permease subunit [Paenibacillus sp. alder61]|uniref:efflux RND transporter permease subunit n=1 Tax=Paenibacillus sp. alder61 TaxID=2862948 RepID=UPI001CD4A666|nr:efflux RND transporter permease subunit [Paenibacillus sp. alder61]MCA1291452.1 efflux RND transporter permease subunit [Paenibacillus sp. alder61]
MIEYSVKKRKITLLLFVMFIVFGIFSATRLPRQDMPDVVIKNAVVTTVFPGATPERVEQSVTKVLEQAIKKVETIEKIESTSSSGVSNITVTAYPDADAKATWDELRKAVEDASADLPDGIIQPMVNDDLFSSFIGSYVIYADKIDSLYALNDQMIDWRDKIRQVGGVADVQISGIPEKEIRIQIDLQKLEQYGIAWEQIVQAVKNMNNRTPLGALEFQSRSYELVVPDMKQAEELNEVLISRSETGFPIYLKDVGQVQMADKAPTYLAYYNGKPAISINVSAQTGSDVPKMDKLISAKLDELKESLPSNVHFSHAFGQEEVVSEMFGELIREMLIAIASVILICTLGLNLVTSLVVAMAIPISIAVGMIVMPFTGISLNEISIVGLIIVLGILVDDAVVVNDNIERRLHVLGESPDVAAIKGAKEVSVSILTATLSTIFAFAPLLFLTGDIGSFVKPIPIVISCSMLASMIMSLTIIPIFRQWHEKRRRRKQAAKNNLIHKETEGDSKSEPWEQKPAGLLGKQIQAATQWYSGTLIPKVLKRPKLFATVGLLIGTASFGLALITPIDLFPEAEEPHVSINVEMPVGTTFQETQRMVGAITKWVEKQPETEFISVGIGGKAPTIYSDITNALASATNIGQITVIGKSDSFKLDKTVPAWEAELTKRFPGATIAMHVPRLGIPVGPAVSIRIAGDELDTLQKLSQQVKEKIAKIDGATGIKDNFGNQSYTLEFEMKKPAMDEYMIDYNTLTQTLRLMGDGLDIGDFDTGKQIVDLNLHVSNREASPNQLFQQIYITNKQGVQVPLAQLAEMKTSFTTQKIQHYNLERMVTVEANAVGKTATELTAEVRSMLKDLPMPEGYTLQFGGETSEQSDIFGDLATLFIVVIFLIFILITVQFYSLSAPIIVMTTVYLAAAGGIIGIFVSGSSIGFMSMMGIISLAGIVVRNGIVLIEFIEESRREGIGLYESVIAATGARFRPIVLTSFTAMIGMLPLAIAGSILFRPMAYTIIFGLMFSTVLTLFVVPSIYMVVAGWKDKRLMRKHKPDQPVSSGTVST